MSFSVLFPVLSFRQLRIWCRKWILTLLSVSMRLMRLWVAFLKIRRTLAMIISLLPILTRIYQATDAASSHDVQNPASAENTIDQPTEITTAATHIEEEQL